MQRSKEIGVMKAVGYLYCGGEAIFFFGGLLC